MIYRLDDLIDSHDFEHDQKFVKAEHWRDACDKLEDKAKAVRRLQAENTQLKEALKNCPILGEVHRDSNDRFKEWNLEFKYVLKELKQK